MTNYEKGRRFEYELVKILKSHGYQAVRTAQSHSPFDVILWKETEENKKICFVAFVQCKVRQLRQGKSNTAIHPETLPE